MDKPHLTEKELEVLSLIARGHDAKSAARHLHVSTHTIYERLRRAREKVGASNSREAARLVFESASADNKNLPSGKFVVADALAVGATLGSPASTDLSNAEGQRFERAPYRAASFSLDAIRGIPVRRAGERDMPVGKPERLKVIAELSARLAMVFVAICLAAMVLSNLMRPG